MFEKRQIMLPKVLRPAANLVLVHGSNYDLILLLGLLLFSNRRRKGFQGTMFIKPSPWAVYSNSACESINLSRCILILWCDYSNQMKRNNAFYLKHVHEKCTNPLFDVNVVIAQTTVLAGLGLLYWSDLSFCLLLYRRRRQLPRKDCSSLFLILSFFIPPPFHSHPSIHPLHCLWCIWYHSSAQQNPLQPASTSRSWTRKQNSHWLGICPSLVICTFRHNNP